MLTTIVAGAFVLGVVVLVHEFGHFIVAKLAGVYVKTFSIGFGKKLLRKRVGETEYTISLLPFGGYVKFAGETVYASEMPSPEEEEVEPEETDEVPDSEIPPERYFTTKRPLIRSAVLFAGPFSNYLLAVVLYIAVFFIQGTTVIPTTRVGEVTPGSPAAEVGLAAGDEIVSVDGAPVSDWSGVIEAVLEGEGPKTLVVRRDADEFEVPFALASAGDTIRLGMEPFIAPRIGRVKRDKPAYQAGMRPGAVIESINDTTITRFDDVQRIINANPEVPLYIRWRFDGHVQADSVTPEAVKVLKPGSKTDFVVVGAIGIGPSYERRRENLVQSVIGGFSAANNMIAEILSYLKLLFAGKMGVDTLGGPILITQMAGDVARWGFDYLVVFLAFFSINLCIFNLLPLLPFDGGHLALLVYEGVAKRPVNRRLRDLLTQGGFILVILLMVFVVMLDISRCSGSGPGLF